MTRFLDARALDITAEAYHADPCPLPSLSSTGARRLSAGCPAEYWHERLHPVRKREFDIGTAGHLLVLEPDLFDARVEVIEGRKKDGSPAEGYTTADARAQRDAAYAAGRVPLLPAEADMVRAMREALREHPVAQHAFAGGLTEQTVVWRCAEFGHWCRARMDWMPRHRRYLVDYKTSTSADPHDFARKVADFGYHQQAAWYLDAVEALTGERPPRFCFVVQSKKPPHLVSVCWLDEEALRIGAELNRYARGVFAHCLARGEWPGFQPELGAAPAAFTISLPPWTVRDFEQRRDAGLLEPPPAAREAA